MSIHGGSMVRNQSRVLLTPGLIRQPKYGHLKELHRAIKLCQKALVSADPTVTSLGSLQQVGVQTSQMEMLPSNADMISWETYSEDLSSLDDSSTFITFGLLEQINVTRGARDYLWYITSVDIGSSESFLRGGELPTLIVQPTGHAFHVFINGQISVIEPSTQDSERGAGKNKRKWSKMEDEKLIEALLELVNAGTHKADNGFRPGYLAVLEDALLTNLPGSDLKARPHIESRIKTLKDFSAVNDMRFGPTSGFGWNDKTHVVTAPSHVWDAYLKVHDKAAKWRYNRFPWFDDLCIIFGKDRATGHDAQTAVDVLEELDKEDANLQGAEDGIHDLNFDSSSMLHDTNSDESTNKKSSKKRSRSMDPVAEVVCSASRMIATQLHETAKMFNKAICEDNLMEQKKKLNEELSNISGIFRVKRYQAAKKMADNENIMILFFAAPNDEKDDFVQALLRRDI